MDVKELLGEIKLLIDKELEKVLPKKGDPQVLYDSAWDYFKSGGKRFRPALIAFACETLGGKIEDTIPAGTALEIAHTFLLIHDDIEDFSEVRRGKPALHIKYGTPHAINTGDFLLMKAYEALLMGNKIWGPEKTMRIEKEFTDMLIKTGIGQALEIDYREKDLSEANIEWTKKVLLHKSGYYTGGTPCAIGAVIANGSEEHVEALRKFGISMAIAFQIQDDIINVTMKEEDEKIAPGAGEGGVGKDFAGDILEGKRTIILAHAFQNANQEDKEVMKKLVGKKDITTEEKKKIIEIMKKYKSIEFAKKYASDMMGDALKEMRENIPENEGREKLETVAEFLIKRKF